jgi:protein-S-isoprenylcysteine O-methyltransferase Ste14
MMAGGWLLYRLAGDYRRSLAGGRGMATMPWRLVTGGPYAYTRNPMYLGHLVFVAGLVLALRSPVALLLLAERWRRFSARVADDERRLAEAFGPEYEAYVRSVPRWLPTGSASRYVTHIGSVCFWNRAEARRHKEHEDARRASKGEILK